MAELSEEALQAIAAKHNISTAELKALTLALEGLTADAIAKRLELSAAAVRKRLGSIYQKFGISGKTPGKLEVLKNRLYAQSQDVPVREPGILHDWGDAISARVFYGRHTKLQRLIGWVVNDRCRLIAILGMGGVGKTTLSVKLAKEVAADFPYLIWRSLREAQTLDQLLEDWFQALPKRPSAQPPATIGQKITYLLTILNTYRCLLVLDNFESILQPATLTGQYAEKYQAYSDLLRRIGESEHQSCLIITSREKPAEITALETDLQSTRTLQLMGSESVSKGILEDKGLSGKAEDTDNLIDRYDKNPLAIKIMATAIRDLFKGDVAAFRAQSFGMLGHLRRLITEQYERLSTLEVNILYWLAINQAPTSLQQLNQDLFLPTVSPSKCIEALEYLRQRSLIEQSDGAFTLPNVVREYMIDRFVETACQELANNQINVLNSHALIKATAHDYIRERQRDLILAPIAQNFLALVGAQPRAWVEQTLSHLRQQPKLAQGYAAGNLLNLLKHLNIEIVGYDFSKLTVRQAYLPQASLAIVKFSQAHLQDCRFSEPFGSVLSLDFSEDGQSLAAGSADGVIRLWQLSPYQQVQSFSGHRDWVWAIAYDAQSHRLASGSADGDVRLWDSHTGQCLRTFDRHHARVWHVSLHKQGKVLVSGSADGEIKVWRAESDGSQTGGFQFRHQVRSIAIHPAMTWIAGGCYDGTILLHHLETGDAMDSLMGDHRSRIQALAVSPDGRLLASTDNEGLLLLWDTLTWQCLNTLTDAGGRLRTLAFSPDGSMLVSAGDDGRLQVWQDLDQPGQCTLLKTLGHHRSWIWAAAVSPDGKTLATGGEDQAIKVWDWQREHCLATLQGQSNGLLSMAVSPDGGAIASSSEDRIIRLWPVRHEGAQRPIEFASHDHRVRTVAFSPTDPYLATGSDDQTIKLWHLETGAVVQPFVGHQDWVRTLAFSPNGQTLVSGGGDATLRVWQVSDGQCLDVLRDHRDAVTAMTFGKDANTLISGSEDETLKIWHLPTGECRHTLPGHQGWILSVAVSPTLPLLASAGMDKKIRLWDMDLCQVTRELRGHTAPIRTLAFDPTGIWLASGSDDKTVRLWNVQTGEEREPLYGHSDWVSSVVFHPENDMLYSASGDQSIRRWQRSTGKYIDNLAIAKPYSGMNIDGVTGLTPAQVVTLKTLGAVQKAMPSHGALTSPLVLL